jgi:hypothetical protein
MTAKSHASAARGHQRPEQQALGEIRPRLEDRQEREHQQRNPEGRPANDRDIAPALDKLGAKRLEIEFEEGAEREGEYGERQVRPCRVGQDRKQETEHHTGDNDPRSIFASESQRAFHVPHPSNAVSRPSPSTEAE